MFTLLRNFVGLFFGGRAEEDSGPGESSGSPGGNGAPAPSKESAAHARASNDFGFALYDRIRGERGNLAFSPTSISAALAMTYGGAKGQTATQMQSVAHFQGDPASTMTTWGDTIRALTSHSAPGRLTIRVANRLFGEQSYPFDADYLSRTKSAFDAPLEPVDFKHHPEPTRSRINRWVEAQTEDRIKDLLPAESVNAETRLALVNAIYFLADWTEPFDRSMTRPGPFHQNGTPSTKNVPMMKRVEYLLTASIDGARVLELSYKGAAAAMWVVLPDAIDGLDAIEKRLATTNLEDWRRRFSGARTFLELPRFEVNPAQAMDLARELKAMGMTDAFDRDTSDFTGIANPPDPRDRVVLSNVFHKAFVKTDEKGTEAAAATSVMGMLAGSAPSKPIEFLVDRPFLFLIVERSSLLVLFMGRVSAL